MTTRAPAETRLLVCAIASVCVASLIGLYLAMTGMLVDMGAMFTRYLIGAGLCLVAVVLAGMAVEVGFRGLAKGAPENVRAWRLLAGSAAMVVFTVVWVLLFPMFVVVDLIK